MDIAIAGFKRVLEAKGMAPFVQIDILAIVLIRRHCRLIHKKLPATLARDGQSQGLAITADINVDVVIEGHISLARIRHKIKIQINDRVEPIHDRTDVILILLRNRHRLNHLATKPAA